MYVNDRQRRKFRQWLLRLPPNGSLSRGRLEQLARIATSICSRSDKHCLRSKRERFGVGAANVKNRLLIHQQYRPPPPRPSPAAGFALRGRGHIGAGFGVCSRMTDSKSVGAVSTQCVTARLVWRAVSRCASKCLSGFALTAPTGCSPMLRPKTPKQPPRHSKRQPENRHNGFSGCLFRSNQPP